MDGRRSLIALAVLAQVGACDTKDGQTSQGTTSTSVETTSMGEETTSAHTDSETTDNDDEIIDDPQAYCQALTQPDECNPARGVTAENEKFFCQWASILVAVPNDQGCGETVEAPQCLAWRDEGGWNPGCIPTPIPGCGDDIWSEPAYLITDTQTLLLPTCSTWGHPLGWQLCTSGEADAAEPPACACVCGQAP